MCCRFEGFLGNGESRTKDSFPPTNYHEQRKPMFVTMHTKRLHGGIPLPCTRNAYSKESPYTVEAHVRYHARENACTGESQDKLVK